MGCCFGIQRKPITQLFNPDFAADLPKLFSAYLTIVTFIRTSNIFKEKTPELTQFVEVYLQDVKNFDKTNKNLEAIDCIFKLHPLDYPNKKDKQWLIAACLRQHNSVLDFPLEEITYEKCKQQYLYFLYLCSKEPTKVIVPNKLADFLWHSHMQDHQLYLKDSFKIFNKTLNHVDDYPQLLQEQYKNETHQLEKKHLALNYGRGGRADGGACGGGSACGGGGGGHGCGGHGHGCGGGGHGCGGGGHGCGGGGCGGHGCGGGGH